MININKLKEEQERLAGKIILTDQFEKIEKIAGIDFIYTNEEIICSIVVIDFKTLKVFESKHDIQTQSFPYIPGFLDYRVALVTQKAFEKLNIKPDIAMISANGIMHPRKFGAASSLGLFLDVPTIGITKKKLCGYEVGDSVYIDKEVVGKIIETKEKAKPIYVSQGHRISLKTMMEIVKEMMKGHKLPEPLYLAHKYGNKVKAKITAAHDKDPKAPDETNTINIDEDDKKESDDKENKMLL
jgi:deoxyribonuclease V